MTWIVTLRGRRDTYGTGLALVARLVSHGAVTSRPFVWQAWHFVTSAAVQYMHACMHTSIHPSIHPSMIAYTQLTHTGLYVDIIAKELALSEAT